MKVLEALQWRYATKEFNPTKKVNQNDLETIKEAFRLTPSSYGLQPWKMLIISNKQVREKLVEHSWNQRQVVDCSHLLVLCRQNQLDDAFVDSYINDVANTRGVEESSLDGYSNMMKSFLNNSSVSERNSWAEKQIYIALGNLMNVCAQLGIDSCPIEGFISEKYNEVLKLTDKGLSSVVLLPIGYRSDNDGYANKAKVRFSSQDVIEEV